jgi:aryl-alcohol dehydrogenase-like predicted oxidoreductase
VRLSDIVSPICFGCEPLGGTDWGDIDIYAIESAIHRALELGVTFFDTAAVYGLGLSEERLSHILGNKRFDVTIATKGGLSWQQSKQSKRAKVIVNGSPQAIQRNIEDSLSRLRLDCLPVFYVHWPDADVPLERTFEMLNKMCDEDKIASIGCSNFTEKQLESACEVSNVQYVQIPVNILTGGISETYAEIISRYNVSIVAYNVLAYGLLTGKYDLKSKFKENDRRFRLPLFNGSQYIDALKRIEKLRGKAQNCNLSLAQYAIHWVLQQPNMLSAVLGIKNSRQIEENCQALTV